MKDINCFLFHDLENYTEGFVMNVPSNLYSKADILNQYKINLNFPSYFGENWDALSECLKDLSWIQDYKVIIQHEDLPHLEKNDLAIYLEILSESIKYWKLCDDHKLIVSFPSRQTISRFLYAS